MDGQKKLLSSKVLVVGAGGLGCPALLYLAAAGVGAIGLVDGDVVSESNLNRQVLFGQKDIGKRKAIAASEKLRGQYPDINFVPYAFYLTNQNAMEVISQYDLVLDGSDNFPTRYMVNDACVLLGKPLVFGAIYQTEGQIGILNHGENSAQYRDLYPDVPSAGEIPNCHETGVLGVLPGIIGSMQAAEAIKLISGYGETLSNKMLFYNLKRNSFYEIHIDPRPKSGYPKTIQDFLAWDYSISCGSVKEIEWDKALVLLKEKGTTFWDIRESHEQPSLHLDKLLRIPLSVIKENASVSDEFKNLILCCQSGVRSLAFGQQLKSKFPHLNVFSVNGGVERAP
jgi:sulfur-carrier protein adenylyltransferase/sulfurtransferase